MQIDTFINDNIYDKQGETIMSYTINYFMTNFERKRMIAMEFLHDEFKWKSFRLRYLFDQNINVLLGIE